MHQSWTRSSLESSWWFVSLWWGATHPAGDYSESLSAHCHVLLPNQPVLHWHVILHSHCAQNADDLVPREQSCLPSQLWPSSTPSTSWAALSASPPSWPTCFPSTSGYTTQVCQRSSGVEDDVWPQPRGSVALCTLLPRPHWRSVCPSAGPTRSSITSVMHQPSSNWPVQTSSPVGGGDLCQHWGGGPSGCFLLIVLSTHPSSIPSWRQVGKMESLPDLCLHCIVVLCFFGLVFSFTSDQAPRRLWTRTAVFYCYDTPSEPYDLHPVEQEWRKLCWSLKTSNCTHKANKLYYVDTHI